MKNEMQIMRLDERQEICWLFANRLTLITLGLVWIGIIAYEFIRGRVPYFFIAMVSVIAFVRLIGFYFYSRRPPSL